MSKTLDPTVECTTLVDILRWRALHQPDRRAYTFLVDGEAFHPCYGLAEATLLVSGGVKSEPPFFYGIQGKALEQGRVVAVSAHDKDSRTLVGCGQTVLDQKIVIVDPETSVPSLPNQVGETWVAGHNIALGYWSRPDETEYTFRAYLAYTGEGPFLRTGDLGFLKDRELFITGRLKDLIIIRGRNYYPQDIELTVEQCHPALRPGCSAAFFVDVPGCISTLLWKSSEKEREWEIAETVRTPHVGSN